MKTTTGGAKVLGQIRKSLWHLRHGGISQYREFRRRQKRRPEAASGRPPLLWRPSKGGIQFVPWAWPDAQPRQRVRAAVIADAFTQSALRYEWEQVFPTPDTWREQLDAEPVDLLFVESAWAGNDGAWRYHLTGTSAPRPALVGLVADYRCRGIPTVFWNKEDPVHFEDFLDTARLFDWVFTTDETRLPAYRERLGHDRVGVLPFAVPDLVCNPVRVTSQHQPRGIAFAGTYFAHKFPERREQMELLFEAALAAETPEVTFDIFSRFLGGDERYQFPEPYGSHVLGSLDYDQMLSAYRSYKVFLNVNSVTDSPTMCARRVLEITACGTPVVSAPSPALSMFLGDGIAQVATPERARATIAQLVADPDARARLVHLGQREIWKRHTWSHRVDQVLETVGLPHAPVELPETSIIASTARPHQLDHLLASVASQVGCRVQLVLGTHRFEPPHDLEARARALGILNVVVVPLSARLRLGDCLNELIGRSDGDVVAKMDDDDLYGPHYLADLLHAMRFAGAEVVGKHCRFVHLAARNATSLIQEMNEHRYSDFVAGPTITARKDVFHAHPFGSLGVGEDSDFLARVHHAGVRIYAADRFSFVQMRSGRPGSHTWLADDQTFLDHGRRIDGLPTNEMMI